MRVKDRLSATSFIQKYLKTPEIPLLLKPKLVTFDAYNTLYSTTLPVMEQYSRLGRKYGLDSSAQELTLKFPKGM